MGSCFPYTNCDYGLIVLVKAGRCLDKHDEPVFWDAGAGMVAGGRGGCRSLLVGWGLRAGWVSGRGRDKKRAGGVLGGGGWELRARWRESGVGAERVGELGARCGRRRAGGAGVPVVREGARAVREVSSVHGGWRLRAR
ncbi:hypothetical protein Acsp05_59340 [Actinokineospora sp. NBRC 105648]|nr:hypothetical protein Acsp05_59340 [Actinokineospora sp. NBRC 105648]